MARERRARDRRVTVEFFQFIFFGDWTKVAADANKSQDCYLFQLWLEIKVRLATLHGEQELGQLEVPFLCEQLHYQFGPCVVGETYVLQNKRSPGATEKVQ